MKYKIGLKLECDYEVEANTKEEAIQQADEWFMECIPNIIYVERIEEK